MSPSRLRVTMRPFPESAAGFHLRMADEKQSQDEKKDRPHAADDGGHLSLFLE